MNLNLITVKPATLMLPLAHSPAHAGPQAHVVRNIIAMMTRLAMFGNESGDVA